MKIFPKESYGQPKADTALKELMNKGTIQLIYKIFDNEVLTGIILQY